MCKQKSEQKVKERNLAGISYAPLKRIEKQIVIKNNLPEKILISGAPFDITKSYVVVMNDYMAGGGDNSAFLTGQKVDVLGVTIRAMMLDYLAAETAAGRKIYSKTEGRIVYAD